MKTIKLYQSIRLRFTFFLSICFISPVLVLQAGEITVYTPEGRDVPAWEFPELPEDDPYSYHDLVYYRWLGDAYIDEWDLNAVRIDDASGTYNCHGYAWRVSEGYDRVWIGAYPEENDPEKRFFEDQNYSNDGLASYISCTESEATHGYYAETGDDHSVRKIQNSYPRPISGGRDYVSKWGYMGLHQHEKNHDPYHGYYKTGQIAFKKLKTTHYGTLSSYPKTWIGAGGQTHTLNGNTTLPNNILTVKSGVTLNLSSFYLKSTGGTITRQSGVTVAPKDISVIISGTSIKGQFQTIADAFNNCSSGQTVDVTGGTHDYSGNLVVDSGKIFAVNGGATIRFGGNAKLQIYSTLVAEGTCGNHVKFTKSGPNYWYGIRFENSSVDANCIVNYADVEYSVSGIYCYYASPTITNNTITNNSRYGVYATNGSPKIQNNTISNTALRGINCVNYSNPGIKNNTISNSDYGIYCSSSSPKIWNNTNISGCDYGIYLTSSSNPDVRTNLIENNTRGIYANGSSSNLYIYDNRITGNGMQVGLDLYDTSEPVVKNNTITGDEMSWGNWGIKADFYSGFQAGGSAADGNNRIIIEGIDIADIRTLRANNHSYMEIGDGEDHGKNAIYCESNGDKGAGVEAYVYSNIYAQKNWWGRYPPVGFLSDGTSYIDHSNPLDYDPPGAGSSLDKAPGSVVVPFVLQEPLDTNSVASLWAWGRQMWLEDRFEEAGEIFKLLVRKFSFAPEAHWALVRIVSLDRKSQSAGLAQYLNRLNSNSAIDSELQMAARELLVSTYKRNGQFDNAVQMAEGILSLAPNTRHEYHALFNLFNIYRQDLEDSTAAADILLKLKTKYPDYELTQIAQFDMGEDVNWSLAKGFDGFDKPYVNEMALPGKFRLGAGHPNPFNPTITIPYDLPEASTVSHVIYSITGREVWRWQQSEQAGYKQLLWHGIDSRGREVGSGVYIYLMTARSLESDQHFTASRKMLLLR